MSLPEDPVQYENFLADRVPNLCDKIESFANTFFVLYYDLWHCTLLTVKHCRGFTCRCVNFEVVSKKYRIHSPDIIPSHYLSSKVKKYIRGKLKTGRTMSKMWTNKTFFPENGQIYILTTMEFLAVINRIIYKIVTIYSFFMHENAVT